MKLTRRALGSAMVFGSIAGGGSPSILMANATPGPNQTSGSFHLLSDPMLMAPRRRSVQVVWFTDEPARTNLVLVGHGVERLTPRDVTRLARGHRIPGVQIHQARTTVLSRTAEDADSRIPEARRPSTVQPRPVRRHEARVSSLAPGRRVPYRVTSVHRGQVALSATYSLAPSPRAGQPVRLMLTSDHQDKPNTPRNMELAALTMGQIDAVVMAGDLVNVPDRASEWFDTLSGSGYFPGLQGRAHRADVGGRTSTGAAIIQNVPLWPAIGNHEVMGRRGQRTSLNEIFNSPVPRPVALAEARRRGLPRHSPQTRRWVEDNSFSTTTYEEIHASLPRSPQGGVRWYATTIGDVRLITLFATRIWRSGAASADPAQRADNSRYQEAATVLQSPLERGHGAFVFEPIGCGSRQYEWLVDQLASRERRRCRYTMVQLHEGPHGLGDNAMPHFCDPVEVVERDASGRTIGIRYEYPGAGNVLVNELSPLLEAEGVQLVFNGHSHLWNRFVADNGITHYLEASNTGNSYGAFHPTSGGSRPVPGLPWREEHYLAQGDPGGLEAQLPSGGGLEPGQPFVASNDHVVFQCFDSGTGRITSWVQDVRDPSSPPRVLDEFQLQAQGR